MIPASKRSDSIPSLSIANFVCQTVFSSKVLVTTDISSVSAFAKSWWLEFSDWRISRPSTELIAHDFAPSCSVPVHILSGHHELRLHTIQRPWRRARYLRGFLVCAFKILYATSETDWPSSTFITFFVEVLSILFATVCFQTRVVHKTCSAGSQLQTGLFVARDLQLGGCCQRSDCCVVRCSDSPLWLLRCLSRLVRHFISRLNFLLVEAEHKFFCFSWRWPPHDWSWMQKVFKIASCCLWLLARSFCCCFWEINPSLTF